MVELLPNTFFVLLSASIRLWKWNCESGEHNTLMGTVCKLLLVGAPHVSAFHILPATPAWLSGPVLVSYAPGNVATSVNFSLGSKEHWKLVSVYPSVLPTGTIKTQLGQLQSTNPQVTNRQVERIECPVTFCLSCLVHTVWRQPMWEGNSLAAVR